MSVSLPRLSISRLVGDEYAGCFVSCLCASGVIIFIVYALGIFGIFCTFFSLFPDCSHGLAHTLSPRYSTGIPFFFYFFFSLQFTLRLVIGLSATFQVTGLGVLDIDAVYEGNVKLFCTQRLSVWVCLSLREYIM